MNARAVSASLLLAAAAALSFGLPKAKYTGSGVLSRLQIPVASPQWRSREVSAELNLEDDRFRFVSQVFARLYGSPTGEQALLLVLDGGNFHHPKTCFSSSGFSVQEMPDTEMRVAGRTFHASTLYAERSDGQAFVVLYWLVINGERVDWTGQKLLQFWFSLRNKQRTSLMVRIDVPANAESREKSAVLAARLMAELGRSIPEDQRGLLLGS